MYKSRINKILSHLSLDKTTITNNCSNNNDLTSTTDNNDELKLLMNKFELPLLSSSKTININEWKLNKNKIICTSEWLLISQDRVDIFATITGDHQFIHTSKAKQLGSPFPPISHGYMILSFLPYFLGSLPKLEGVKLGLNYGINKLRFISPVIIGKRIRVIATLKDIIEGKDSFQNIISCVVEIEGEKKPAFIAEVVYAFYLK